MRFGTIFGILSAVALYSGAARAEETTCHQQIHQLCGNFEPGDGQFRECVKTHKSELSADCQAKLEQRHQKMKEKIDQLMAVCADDLKTKCSDIVPGGGRKLMCLVSHEPTLTPQCAAAIKEGRHKLHAMRACRDDAQSLCAGVPREDGQVKACLESHRAQLSPACNEAIGG